MRRPLSVWFLVGTLLVLALGGLVGAYGFLSDPSGAGMGMAAQLERLPVPDYTLPGLFLLGGMCAFPLLLVHGLLVRPRWAWLDACRGRSGAHWAWVGSLGLGVLLALWLATQAVFIGFSAPIQWFTALLDLSILVNTLLPPTREHYRGA